MSKGLIGFFVLTLAISTRAALADSVVLGGNQSIPPGGDPVCLTGDADGDGRGDVCDPSPSASGWGPQWFADVTSLRSRI